MRATLNFFSSWARAMYGATRADAVAAAAVFRNERRPSGTTDGFMMNRVSDRPGISHGEFVGGECRR
jgi:hypothetical protein